MRSRNLPYTITLTFLFFIGGCTHHYVPDPNTFPLDATIEFSSKNSVSLVNGQTSSKDVLVANAGVHEHYGNLQKWTDAAITITRNKLTERGMSVVDGDPRSLTLSIDSADVIFGAWVIRSMISMKVETGSGYVATYKGDNRSPASMGRAVDGAVMRAVAAMLKDQNITDYLVQ